MGYLDIANSKLMFALCCSAIVVVFFQSLIFVIKARKRALELGISKNTVNKAVINSAMFSILPSLPIIIMFLALSVSLGIYFPWLRLSVVGSAVYEGMAAEIAAKEAGLFGFTDPAMTPSIFLLIMWVMSVGIIWGIVFNIFFMKKLDNFSKKLKSSKSNFIPIFSSALFCGLLAALSVPFVANIANKSNTIVFISSGLMALLCNKISQITKISIISDFSLPIALVFGMFVAIAHAKFI